MSAGIRVRFAPSPTGQLHVGNARTALFNWLLARAEGGTFVLRIEDTDFERSTKDAERTAIDDLRWLGLTWDEGAEVGGPYGPYRQSERLHVYRAHAVELMSKGLAYHCFCSEEDLERERYEALRAGMPPKYGGRCRGLSKDDARRRLQNGETAVVRFRVPEEPRDIGWEDVVRGPVSFRSDVIGDFVLLRSDGVPAYNFAVVIDDALMAITHVVRGEDHISNTPRQVLLYEAFGWRPPTFAHVSMVLGPDHSKLSKRHGATSVSEFRETGILPEALANYLALLGWSPGDNEELFPLDELARRFRLADVGKSAGVFDPDKLAWVNRHYLKTASHARLVDLTVPFLRSRGWMGDLDDTARAVVSDAVGVAVASVDRLDQVPSRLQFLFDYSAPRALEDAAIRAEADAARPVIEALAAETATGSGLLDRETFRAMATRVRERTGAKGRALFHPLRLAVTGEAEGLELDLAVPLIDRAAAANLGARPVLSIAARAAAFLDALTRA